MDEPQDISGLSLDDQFMILLHKKIMNKACRSQILKFSALV
jgi:hypothetical protein